MSSLILIVDDQEDIRRSLTGILEDEGYQVLSVDSGSEALEVAREAVPDLVLLDIWMPGMDGIETLERLKSLMPDLTVVMMSGHGTIETAVKATKLGAYDFVEKPFSLDKVLITIANAISFKELRKENDALRSATHAEHELVGASPALELLREQVLRVALTATPVLICGEAGVGKELAARSVHHHSARANKPFVAVNCSAIPGDLLESELFGHEKGAFPGATSQRKGKFDLAEGGTIFLDDINEMPLKLQGMLLQFLRERSFERPGGGRSVRLDVRVVVATAVPLADLTRDGQFRSDLCQQINVVPLMVPPLRERREDIPHLVRHFVSQFHRHEGWDVRQFDDAAIELLQGYSWPGNARELKNLVERVLIMSSGSIITADDIPLSIPAEQLPAAVGAVEKGASLRGAREQFERQFLLEQLRLHNWDIDTTARAVELERTILQRKLLQYGLAPSDQHQ